MPITRGYILVIAVASALYLIETPLHNGMPFLKQSN